MYIYIYISTHQRESCLDPLDIVFSPIFILLDSFSKPNFSYMITYVKAHHFVIYKFVGWRGAGNTP